MPENERPQRRRRRPTIPQTPVEPEQKPVRIVVEANEDAPEWMVSASSAAGAASRRAGTEKKATKAPKTPERRVGAQIEESQHIEVEMAEKKETAEKPAATKPKTGAGKTVSGAKSTRGRGAVKAKKAPMTKKQKAKRAKQIRKTVLSSLLGLVVIALLGVGVISGRKLLDIKQTLDRGAGVFYPNIYVNNISLAGMPLDQAAREVTQQVASQVSSWRITLRTQDGRTWDITGEDLNMKYDVADQLDQLWAIGHNGSSAERYEQVKQLEEGEPIRRYTTLTYDLSSVFNILTQIKSEIDTPAVSAMKIYDDSVFPPYTYTDDTPGVTLDITGLNDQICGMVQRLESGTVDVTPTIVEAAVTRKALEAQITKLASFETMIATSSTEGRIANIQLGTSMFNHKVIKAGEKVSFNKVTGKRIERNGFQEALELAYGDYRMGWGGGICQVSSTLYNAVVAAGLKVTERHQHSLASSYVDKGCDATVQDDRLDFVFQNNTGAEIFIETNFYKKKGRYYTQFVIYGRPDPEGHTYKLDSKIREEIPIPEPELRPDKDATYVVYNDETYVYTKGEVGYIVDVYLVTMDSKGLEISRELSYTDTYKARTPVTYVGVTPRETMSY